MTGLQQQRVQIATSRQIPVLGKVGLFVLGGGRVPPAGGADSLLQEDGASYILQETGDRILLE